MHQLEKTGKHSISHQDSRGRCHQLSLLQLKYHTRRSGREAGKLLQAQSCVREAKIQTRAAATSHHPLHHPDNARMQEEGNTEQKRHDPMIRLVKMPSMPPPRQLQPPWAHQAGDPLLSPTPCSVPTSPCHLPGKYTVFRTPHPHEACSPCLESRPRASAPLLSQQQQTPLSSLASYPGPATSIPRGCRGLRATRNQETHPLLYAALGFVLPGWGPQSSHHRCQLPPDKLQGVTRDHMECPSSCSKGGPQTQQQSTESWAQPGVH